MQRLLGLEDVKTPVIYTHVSTRGGRGVPGAGACRGWSPPPDRPGRSPP